MSLKVVVHNGVFHADDVAAVATLSFVFDFTLVRTRDWREIGAADVVIDVGGIYDLDTLRFDHHQKGGAGVRENGVPFASFGLMWRHFGAQVCEEILGSNPNINSQNVAEMVEESLVLAIDARDNGVKTHFGVNFASPYTISDAVSDMNPNWNEFPDYNESFERAVEFFRGVLKNTIRKQGSAALAENLVLEMIKSQSGSKFLVLDRFVPWTSAVVETQPQALYVIFPDYSGTWRVQAVPKGLGKDGFDLKAPLPEGWRGAKSEELRKLTACEGATFCHNSGFIMGTETREQAIRCAELAVSLFEVG